MVKQEKQQFLRPGTKFSWVFLHRTVDNTRIYNLKKKGKKECITNNTFTFEGSG